MAFRGAAALRFACILLLGEVPVITGPEEGAAAGGGHFRVAHTDREHVIDTLKTAFAVGRLTKDELDARAGQAFTARTYAELAALTADIPAGPLAVRPSRQPARPQNRPKRTHPVRNAAIGSVSCLTGAAAAFLYGVSLDDHNTLLFLYLTFFALLAVPCISGRRRSPHGSKGTPAASYRRDRDRGARPRQCSGTAAPAMILLPPVPAPTIPAPTCGPAGPGQTGRAHPGGVSRCRAVPGQYRARPEPLLTLPWNGVQSYRGDVPGKAAAGDYL
jgi:hypothetical protein